MADEQKKTPQQVADEIARMLESSGLTPEERKEAVKILARKEGVIPDL